MINIIAAVSSNRVIGKNGKIPWNFPEDKKWFRKVTCSTTSEKPNVIVFGRKTFEEFGTPLPGRINVVLSSSDMDMSGITVLSSVKSVLDKYKDYDIFFCGGFSVYKETLSYAERLYITHIEQVFDGDVFFPEFEKSDYIKETVKTVNEPYRASFCIYTKR